MKKRAGNNQHTMDFLFVLFLFAAFALSSLMLVTVGAGVYRKTVNGSERNFTVRTASAYLTEKLRQAGVCAPDGTPALSLASFGGGDALVLAQSSGGSALEGQSAGSQEADNTETLLTYIYFYDGSLRELNCRKGAAVGPEAGREILPLRRFCVEEPSASLYRSTLEDEEGRLLTFLVGAPPYGSQTAPSGSRNPSPGESGVREPSPGESGVREPSPGESGVREPSPGESSVREPSPGEFGVREPSPGESGVREPSPGESGEGRSS